jgi:hypothetical protein
LVYDEVDYVLWDWNHVEALADGGLRLRMGGIGEGGIAL